MDKKLGKISGAILNGKLMRVVIVIVMVATVFTVTGPNNAGTSNPCVEEFFALGDYEGTDIGKIYIYPSNGDGTFENKQEIGDVVGKALGLTIADYDNDGDLDVTAVSLTGKAYLFVNNCDGTFTQNEVTTGLDLNHGSEDSATADFNDDGYYDFLVPSDHSTIYLFTNNQDNTFTKTEIDASWLKNPGGLHRILGIDAGDFDEDGNMDFALVEYASSLNDPPYNNPDDNIWLYRGNGDGTFTWELAFTNLNCQGNPIGETRSATVGDFNGDEHLDLIVGQDDDGDPGQAWLYLGDGTGTFSLAGEAYDTNTIRELEKDRAGRGTADAYDFDHDGILDIVATGYKANAQSSQEYGTWYFKGNGDGTFQNGLRVDTYLGIGIAAPSPGYTVNQPPVADAGEDLTVYVGDEVQFDGSGSYDPDGTIVNYTWEFGDGISAYGVSASHIYHIPGTYDINLAVIDNDGLTDTDTMTVTVLGLQDLKQDTIHELESFEYQSGKCKGITNLTLEYLGGAGADIIVEKGAVTDNGDGTYTITPEEGKEKLSSNTKIFIDGELDTEIHTSCSKPLDVGDVFDDFTVVDIDKIPKLPKHVQNAIDHIKKSLNIDPKHPDKPWKKYDLWIGETHLDQKHGKKVFYEEKKAVKYLMKASKCKGITSLTLENTGPGAMIEVTNGGVFGPLWVDSGEEFTILPEDGKSKLGSNTVIIVDGEEVKIHTSCSIPLDVGDVYDDLVVRAIDKIYKNGWSAALEELSKDVIDKLVAADKMLAEIAFEDALNTPVQNPNHQDKYDKEIEKVQDEMLKAEDELAKGHPDKAIDHYKKAWEHVQKAIQHAEKK